MVGLEKAGRAVGRVFPRASPSRACVLQVAEMHGELIEFNERLHRALVAKEALVSQMRQELIDLRGPVSAPALSFCPRCLPTTSAAHNPSVTCVQCQGHGKVQRLKGEHLGTPTQILHALALTTLAFLWAGRGKINNMLKNLSKPPWQHFMPRIHNRYYEIGTYPSPPCLYTLLHG